MKVTSTVLRFAVAIGFVVATLITIIITAWEWIENPGGIFRGPNGTNWQFVFETATSWFIPSFVSIVVVAALGCLIRNWLRRKI